MSVVKISELQAQTHEIVARASGGEVVVIAESGVPMAKIIPYDMPADAPAKPSPLGCMRGLGTFDPYMDFKAIARDEIMEMFYGEDWDKDEPAS